MDKELTNFKLEAIGVKNEFISAEPTEDETKWVKKNTPVNQIPILFYISLRRIGNCIAIINYTDFTNILNHLGNFI